jgi:hypothetical protein
MNVLNECTYSILLKPEISIKFLAFNVSNHHLTPGAFFLQLAQTFSPTFHFFPQKTT